MIHAADQRFEMNILEIRLREPAIVFCPMRDAPVDEEIEKQMDAMSPHGYLAYLCRLSGTNVDLRALDPANARRTARMAIRFSPDRKDKLFLN